MNMLVRRLRVVDEEKVRTWPFTKGEIIGEGKEENSSREVELFSLSVIVFHVLVYHLVVPD